MKALLILTTVFLTITSANALGQRRKCIKSGGTWVVTPAGVKFCMKAAAKAGDSSERALFARKKCLRSGGIWMVSSNGKFCMKKLGLASE